MEKVVTIYLLIGTIISCYVIINGNLDRFKWSFAFKALVVNTLFWPFALLTVCMVKSGLFKIDRDAIDKIEQESVQK